MTTTTKSLKVAEYRELISTGWYWLNSCRSCHRSEQEREAVALRNAVREIMEANCPRAKEDDRMDAERMVDASADWLIKNELY